MAGVLKARDSDGSLKTVTTIKARDVGGILRTLQFIRVRDAGGVLREVFTAMGSGGGGGGGGTTPPPSNPTYITPADNTTSSRAAAASAYFTGNSSTTAPSAFTWGVLDGPGLVVSGGNAATAQLRVTAASTNDPATATFFCDMVVAAVTYRATCTMTHTKTEAGGTTGQSAA